MNVYTKHIDVQHEDLDELNHVNNVRYVQWIQDIAKEHWELVTDEELQQRFIWVVVTHHIEYKKPALFGDTVVLKTWIADSSGVISTRMVEMKRKSDNTLLVKAKTTWCLLNSQTFKPMRIPEELADLFADE